MTHNTRIAPQTTALLAMDFQTLIVDGHARDKQPLLDRTAKLLAAARNAHMTVIYVVVGFRPGFPEISDDNMTFRTIKETNRFAPGAANTQIHPAVAARPDEVVVQKHRVSAFAGTDLEMILRSKGIGTLLLTGIATSGVVLSTLRHAADADYRLFVVKDCCADSDEQVHHVLTEKVFPRQATVVSADEIIGEL